MTAWTRVWLSLFVLGLTALVSAQPSRSVQLNEVLQLVDNQPEDVESVKNTFYGLLILQEQLRLAKTRESHCATMLELAKNEVDTGAAPAVEGQNAQAWSAEAQHRTRVIRQRCAEAQRAIAALVGLSEQDQPVACGDFDRLALEAEFARLAPELSRSHPPRPLLLLPVERPTSTHLAAAFHQAAESVQTYEQTVLEPAHAFSHQCAQADPFTRLTTRLQILRYQHEHLELLHRAWTRLHAFEASLACIRRMRLDHTALARPARSAASRHTDQARLGPSPANRTD